MPPIARRVSIVLAVVLLTPIALAAGALLLVQSKYAERWIEARVGKAIDREVEIDGIGIKLTAPLGISVHRLRIANPRWAKSRDLVDARDLFARVEIRPLFQRRFVVPYLSARAAVAGLEQDGERATWRFGGGERKPSPLELSRVSLEDGRITYRDEADRTALEFHVTGALGHDAEMKLRANGTFRGATATGTARVPSLEPSPDQSIRIDAKARIGETRVAADGEFASTLDSLDLQLDLAGSTLHDLDQVFGVKLPDTPPYTIRGRLRHTGGAWVLDPFRGKVGDSDLSGAATYRKGGGRPFLKAELESKLLDFDDLGPLVGAPPKTGPGETAAPEQKKKAAARAGTSRVLPHEPFHTGRLKAMDADVRLKAKRVQRPKHLPIDALAAHIVLKDAVLRLDPLSFAVAGGKVAAHITLDAREAPIHGDSDIDVQGLNLSRLFPAPRESERALGILYGRAKLRGRGDSVGKLLGTSSGQLSLAVDGGRVGRLLVELLGLDLAESAMLLGGRAPKQTQLRCAVAEFAVKGGVARASTFVVDTNDTVVKVEGSVDLAKERIDLTTYPEPKDMSIFALRSPVRMQGPLKKPAVHPKAGPLVARGAVAAALAAANPLLALLAFVETGPGKDSNCRALLAGVKAKGAVKKRG